MNIMKTKNSAAKIYLSKTELLNYFLYSVIVLGIGIFLLYTKLVSFYLFILFIFLSYLKHRSINELSLYISLLLVTNVFEFASLEQLPYLQLMPGIRFNLLDIITTLNFLLLFNKIINLQKTPSRWIVFFVLITSLLYVFIGFILTLTPRGAGTNYLRVLFYISFYFYFFLYFDNLDKIKKMVAVLSFWILIATLIQVIEYFQNYRFTLPGIIPHSDFYSEEGQKIFTIGSERIYLWSRVTVLMFINLPFVLMFYSLTKQKFYLIVVILSFLGFFIALSRIWFLGLVIITLLTIIVSNRDLKFKIVNSLIVISIVLFVFQIYSLEFTRFDFLASLLGRTHSIITLGQTYGEMDTFTIRVWLFNKSFNKFLESPLFGWGFGEKIWNEYFTIDLGSINRLVFFGLFGTIPLIYYIFSYSLSFLPIIRFEKNLIIKLLGFSVFSIFISHFPMYIWQIDFWGQNYVIPITMVMAIGDRVLTNKLII